MPDGYRIPPHFHPTDEHIEVKQGTFLVGMGDKLDLAKVISLTMTGPFIMTYVRLEDEPWHGFPFSR